MREEARFTGSYERRLPKGGYRKLPIQFVKAREVYDPNTMIQSLLERSNLVQEEEPTIEVVYESEVDSDTDEAEIDATLSAANLVDEIMSLEEATECVTIQEETDIIMETAVSGLEDPLLDIESNYHNASSENEAFEREYEESVIMDTIEPNIGLQEELMLDSTTRDYDNEESSEASESDSEDSESEIDENDFSALSFLIDTDMDGGDDIFIERTPSPAVRKRRDQTSLQFIKEIGKTSINDDDDLEFEVVREIPGLGELVETMTYEEIVEENRHLGMEEIDEEIQLLGGIISTEEVTSTSVPADLADMIDSLSSLQGGSKKSKTSALNRLAAVAAEVDPDFNNNSYTKRKERVPSFSSADPSLREGLIEDWLNNKHTKALKRQVRQELRQEGKLSKEYKEFGFVNLKDRYPEKMPIFAAVTSLQEFLENPNQASLAFPPMAAPKRKVIKDLASCYYIHTSVVGAGKDRFVLCTKNYKSSFKDRDQDLIGQIVNQHAAKQIRVTSSARSATKVTVKGANKRERKVPAPRKATQVWKEGDLVGHDAEEISISNIGRQMLERIGWKEGMSLGHTNQGIAMPIFARVKTKKHGLGS